MPKDACACPSAPFVVQLRWRSSAVGVTMSLSFDIPGFGAFEIRHMLFDLNGTLADNGVIADSTRERLQTLGRTVSMVVMSADTHGTLDQVVAGLPLEARRVQQPLGRMEKLRLLMTLGSAHTIAIGNGRNDIDMLRKAAIGIAVLGSEGAAREALLAADIVFATIDDALDSLLQPKRLIASLRG